MLLHLTRDDKYDKIQNAFHLGPESYVLRGGRLLYSIKIVCSLAKDLFAGPRLRDLAIDKTIGT